MKKSQLLAIGAFVSCLLGLLGNACGEPEIEMTPEQRLDAAHRHASSAVSAIGQRWAVRQSEYFALESLGALFDSHLNALAKLADSELLEQARAKEGDAPLFKLMLIADYRRRNADRIRAIARHFTRPTWDGRYRPPSIPWVTGDWAKAGDRLAWEYLLLRPSARHPHDASQFTWRATDALARTGDAASIQTYSIMIKSALMHVGQPGDLPTEEIRHMLWAMTRIPSRAGLSGLVEADAWLREAPCYRAGDSRDSASCSASIRSLRNTPRATLRATLRYDIDGRWKSALDEFARVATPEQKAMLVNSVLTTLIDDVVDTVMRAHRAKARAAKEVRAGSP